MGAAVTAGCYVFAVVPAGSGVPAADGDGPAAGLELIESGGLAALVGRVPTDRPLGRSKDLRAHDRVIAEVLAAGTPVLPMRFGAVVADEDAVVAELLEPHRDEFEDALGSLAHRVQYTVRVQYEQDEVLRDLLATRPDIRRARAAGAADHGAQVRLGELVVRALEGMRPADASAIVGELIGTVDIRVREPSAPDEVLDAAFLVETAQAAAFEERVEQAAARRAERMRFRLVGPTAAYDFVGSR